MAGASFDSELKNRMAEAWGHAKEARQSLKASVESLVPPAFVEHGRAAQKEALLAVRSLVDFAIDKVDGKVDGKKPE